MGPPPPWLRWGWGEWQGQLEKGARGERERERERLRAPFPGYESHNLDREEESLERRRGGEAPTLARGGGGECALSVLDTNRPNTKRPNDFCECALLPKSFRIFADNF